VTAVQGSTDALRDRWGLWPLRILWFALPFYFGFGMGEMLETRSGAVSTVAEIGLWFGWFVGLVTLMAPSTVSLTVLRVLSPIAPVGFGLAAIVQGDFGALAALALGGSALTCGVSFLPTVGDQMVNGSAYGAERRLALRPPAGALVGPVQVTWIAAAVSLCTGPLLLAAKQWVVGGLAVALGAITLQWAARILHQLARRWVVFVPVGFVVHDYYVLAESLLLQRKSIVELGPAPSQPVGAADISAGALGLALQVELVEPVPIALRNRQKMAATSTPRLIFTPSLPGRLLAEARVRGLKIKQSED